MMCGKLKKKIIQRKKNLFRFVKETKLLCQRAKRGEISEEDLLKEYLTKCWPLVASPLKDQTIKRKIRIMTHPSLGIGVTILMFEDILKFTIIRGRLREINWLLKNL